MVLFPFPCAFPLLSADGTAVAGVARLDPEPGLACPRLSLKDPSLLMLVESVVLMVCDVLVVFSPYYSPVVFKLCHRHWARLLKLKACLAWNLVDPHEIAFTVVCPVVLSAFKNHCLDHVV